MHKFTKISNYGESNSVFVPPKPNCDFMRLTQCSLVGSFLRSNKIESQQLVFKDPNYL